MEFEMEFTNKFPEGKRFSLHNVHMIGRSEYWVQAKMEDHKAHMLCGKEYYQYVSGNSTYLWEC